MTSIRHDSIRARSRSPTGRSVLRVFVARTVTRLRHTGRATVAALSFLPPALLEKTGATQVAKPRDGGGAAAGAAALRGAERPAGRRSRDACTSPQGMCGSTNCAARRHSRGETGETRGGERARGCVCWSGVGEEPVQAGSSQRTPAPRKPAHTSSIAPALPGFRRLRALAKTLACLQVLSGRREG